MTDEIYAEGSSELSRPRGTFNRLRLLDACAPKKANGSAIAQAEKLDGGGEFGKLDIPLLSEVEADFLESLADPAGPEKAKVPKE